MADATWRRRAWRWVCRGVLDPQAVLDAARESVGSEDLDWIEDRNGRVAVDGLAAGGRWMLYCRAGQERTFVELSWVGPRPESGSGFGHESSTLGGRLRDMGVSRFVVDDDDIDIH